MVLGIGIGGLDSGLGFRGLEIHVDLRPCKGVASGLKP